MIQLFGNQAILIDVHQVYDQIGRLENSPSARAARTKEPSEFRRLPLKGLWHAHWFEARFIPGNLQNEIQRDGLGRIIQSLELRHGKDIWEGKLLEREDIAAIVHEMVFGSLERRSQREWLTGEWIVFAKSNGRNIYLALGAHGESDDAVFARCLPALNEFPELSEIEAFRAYLATQQCSVRELGKQTID